VDTAQDLDPSARRLADLTRDMVREL